ncbi:Hypothetical protein PHPALM_5006, partial [Phytophthora palmivora]
ARKPRGLSVDYTYVKPGIRGRLEASQRNVDYFIGTMFCMHVSTIITDLEHILSTGENELMAFARKNGLLLLLPLSVPIADAVTPTLPPLAAPEPVPAQSLPSSANGVGGSPIQPTTLEEPATRLAQEHSLDKSSPTAETSAPDVTEEVVDTTSSILYPTEQPLAGKGVSTGHDSDYLEMFDGDQFMDALRTESLFGPVATDDINLCDSRDVVAEDEDAAVSDEELGVPASLAVEYDSDIVSDSDFEDESELFEQDDSAMRELGVSGWTIYDEHQSSDLQLPGATDLYGGSYGPTRSAAAFAESPLGMFFYFMPKKLWLHIEKETNDYRLECIPVVAKQQRTKQLLAQAKDPRKSVQSIEELEEKLRRAKPVKAHEILHVIGLLIARTLCGHTDGLEKHWATCEDGAVPRGTFGRFMKRDRFKTITRYLHFASNASSTAATDKAWKVRPVLQVIEKTFRRGYRLGARVSFDEGTIPNRCKFNPIRVYNKDKPHKYGTKCYMTCCADTGYCSR